MPVRRHAAVSFLKCTLMIANNRHHHHDARREYPSRGKRVGSMVARVSNLSTSTPVRHLELHRLPFLPTACDLHQTNVSSFPAANTGQPARASSRPDVSVFATLPPFYTFRSYINASFRQRGFYHAGPEVCAGGKIGSKFVTEKKCCSFLDFLTHTDIDTDPLAFADGVWCGSTPFHSNDELVLSVFAHFTCRCTLLSVACGFERDAVESFRATLPLPRLIVHSNRISAAGTAICLAPLLSLGLFRPLLVLFGSPGSRLRLKKTQPRRWRRMTG